MHGVSVEFADYREYSPAMISNASTGAPTPLRQFYIKRYEEDTNLRGTILLDASKSMAYGRKGHDEYQYAATLAASIR